MMEALRPPDIEVAIVAVLTEQDGPWVATRYPSDPADEAAGVIRVSATGGASPTDLVVIHPTVLVECWHEDEATAHGIAADAWSKLVAAAGSIVGGVSINAVSLTMPVNNPDTDRRNLSRYQFVAEVWTRLAPPQEV